MPENTPEVPAINTPWWKDKPLWVATLMPVMGVLCLWLNSKLPIPVDPSTLANFLAGVLVAGATYIGGNKWKTTVLTKAAMQHAADAPERVTTVKQAVDVLRTP